VVRADAHDGAWRREEITMTMQIRSLMFVAAVAILPVACGTSSPMGTDLAALEAPTQVTSFRSDPTVPVPPQAPDSPEANTDPAPSDPGNIPEASPKPEPSSHPAPPPNAPGNDTNTDPNNDPLPSPAPPNGDPASVPALPTNDGIPVPPAGDPQAIPVPSPAPPNNTDPCVGNAARGCTTAPTPVPPTEPAACEVAEIDILLQDWAIAGPSGQGFMAILKTKSGSIIEDDSCEKLAWAVEGARDVSRRIVIHYVDNSRFVYVEGLQGGTYKVGVTAPNGVAASIGFEVK
jgi:hypothetical protein